MNHFHCLRVSLNAVPGVVVCITSLFATGYTSRPADQSPMPRLTHQEKSYIKSISPSSRLLPAWLIAQLLDASDNLYCYLSENSRSIISNSNRFEQTNFVPFAEINHLLADPSAYQGRLIGIKSTLAKSMDVSSDLQLSPGQHCWTVYLVDSTYRRTLQVFTTQNPNKFTVAQRVYVFGYFLTNRIDEEDNAKKADPMVIPVLVGSIFPIEETDQKKNEDFRNFFLTFLVVLTLIYLYLKIANRKLRKAETFHINTMRRKKDEN
jgi:hypothetical protein